MENDIFQKMLLEQLGIHMQKNLDTDHMTFMIINYKWIIKFAVKCKTLKLLEYNGLATLGLAIFFFKYTNSKIHIRNNW